MIEWKDIVLLTLSCVLANHMGLIDAIEKVIESKLPIVNCVKCFSFWSVLLYCIFSDVDLLVSVAISFLFSYLAIWLELFFGFIDICYEKLYKTAYKDAKSSNKTNTDNKDNSYSENELP